MATDVLPQPINWPKPKWVGGFLGGLFGLWLAFTTVTSNVFQATVESQQEADYFVCYDATECNAGSGSGWSTSGARDGLSKTTPWQCPSDAEGNVNPGTTILFGDGNYTYSRCGYQPGATSSRRLLTASSVDGTVGNWVTLKSENKWGAVWDGEDTARWEGDGDQGARLIRLDQANYIAFEDFEIKRAFALFWDNTQNSTGPYSHDILIKGNLMHDCKFSCVQAKYFDYGWTIDSNHIWDVRDATDANNKGVHAHNLYLMGYNHTVINNVLSASIGGTTITIGGICSTNGTSAPNEFTHTIHVYNNTIVGNGANGDVTNYSYGDRHYVIDLYSRAHNQTGCTSNGTPYNFKNIRFANNLFLNGKDHPEDGQDSQQIGAENLNRILTTTLDCNHYPWVRVSCGDFGYMEVLNNVAEIGRPMNTTYCGYNSTTCTGNVEDAPNINIPNRGPIANQLLYDADLVPFFDYQPVASGSSSISNAGTATYAPTLDINGNPRGVTPDVGAYEL